MFHDILKPSLVTPLPDAIEKSASVYGKTAIYGVQQNVNLSDCKLAIVGVCESRNSSNSQASKAPDEIRKFLYSLSGHPISSEIVDLGNISETSSPASTYAALKIVVEQLAEKGICVIVLGGTQELTLPIFQVVAERQSPITISIIDSKIDYEPNSTDFSPSSFVNRLLSEDKGKLYCINHIAHQSYLTDQRASEILEKRNHDVYRLGSIRNAMTEVEPALRSSHIVSFDMGSIRQSDYPLAPSPNGLYAEEACLLSRFAGLSGGVKAFGLFNLNTNGDSNAMGSHLAAQIVWHFIEGFFARKGKAADPTLGRVKKFYVKSPIPNVNMVFLKNISTQTWWIEVPIAKGDDSKNTLLACSQNDYKMATKGDVPDRWLRAIRRVT